MGGRDDGGMWIGEEACLCCAVRCELPSGSVASHIRVYAWVTN